MELIILKTLLLMTLDMNIAARSTTSYGFNSFAWTGTKDSFNDVIDGRSSETAKAHRG
eukprot:TRINITY_DN8192_c0_g1_i1.p1 TRINITY_DN8192_c0_g1~~TRINITY_DN8192_c0_g1_i1.p1  ORF type:complete len:58 (+),score=18.25 TRINITY_DN8192_c0_g1_i1:81-254(+)